MKTSHIVIGLIMVAAAYFGYQYWQKNKAASTDSSKKDETKTPPAPATSGAAASKFEGDDNSLSQVLGG